MAGNKQRLVNTYRQVKAAAPEARLYVHGYPQFIRGGGGECANNVRLDDNERAFAARAIQYMNDIVEAAAKEAGVYYVDVEGMLDGNRLCDYGDMFVNGVTKGNDKKLPVDSKYLLATIGNESFHPNPKGFVRYKDAILHQTDYLASSMPAAKSTDIPLPPIDVFGEEANIQVAAMNSTQTHHSRDSQVYSWQHR